MYSYIKAIFLILEIFKEFVLDLLLDAVDILEEESRFKVILNILPNFRICAIIIHAGNAIQSDISNKMYENIARSKLFCEIAEISISNFFDRLFCAYEGKPH